jgi:hypothetical protein
MRKTSVYLEERHLAKLKRLSHRTEKAPAEIIRDAIDALPEPDNEFAIFGSFESDDPHLSETPRKELLRGFGER